VVIISSSSGLGDERDAVGGDGAPKKKELRIIYYIGISAIAILEVFTKTTRTTPQSVLDHAKKRLRQYRARAEGSDI
jgi:hypothetical protein